MKIAISGCGIAGAAVAGLLARGGHQVEVFEQAQECKAIGAGILVSPRGQELLDGLGLLDELTAESAPINAMRAVRANGRPLVELAYARLRPELHGLGVHRGKLFQRLVEWGGAAGVAVRNGFCTATAEREAGGIRLVDAAGNRSGLFDFVIAADGSRSPLRKACRIKVRTLEYSHAALWTTAPCRFQPGYLYQVVRGTSHLTGLLPIGNGESSFFWGLPADGLERLRGRGFATWQDEVVGLCPESESVFDTVRSFDQLTFAGYRHVTMNRWHDERIIFLGDAAHPTSPHLGQGVNLALEDVVQFAAALASTGDFSAAARQYETQRRRQLRYYQQLTRLISPFFQSHGRIRGLGRDWFLPWFPRIPWVHRQMLRTLCGYKQGWLG